MTCRLSLTTLAVVMTTVAVIFNALGLFLKEWWITETKVTLGLMTEVQCPGYVCTLSAETSDGWIVFVRVIAYAQFVMLLVAIATMCLGRLCKAPWLTNAAIACLTIACVCSLLLTFTLITVYPKLTNAMIELVHRPRQYVLYQTLPLGLVAISGTFCVPAFVSLAIRQTKTNQEEGTKGNMVV